MRLVVAPIRTSGLLAGLAEVLDLLGTEPRTRALRGGKQTLGTRRNIESGVNVRAGGVRLDGVLKRQLQCTVDHLPAGNVFPVDERDSDARCTSATRAANAVQVGLLILGALVVDDVRDIVNVDATRGDVGGDQHVDLARAECAKRLLARTLAKIAVHGTHGEAALGEFIARLLRATLGLGEHHREFAAIGLQDARKKFDLVHGVHAPHMLLDRIDRGVVVAGIAGANVRGVRHVATREIDDLPGHRCGEQHRLALVGDHRHDALNVGQEAHVEHLVGLVEHQHAHVRQVHVAAVGEIDDAPGCADDHIDALGQCLDLRFVCATAVDGEHAKAFEATGALEVGGHLQTEFAGGADDKSLRLAGGSTEGVVAGGAGGVKALKQRDAEAERLTGARLGLADDVVALKGHGHALLLDGKSVGNAVGRQGLGDERVGAQFDERGGRGGIDRGGGQGVLLSVMVRGRGSP